MSDADRALVAGVVGIVVQALKPLRLDAAFYGVVAILIGVAIGALIGYTRDGYQGLAPGMTGGIEAALLAAGAYSVVAAASRYEKPARQRDARGRFVKAEE